MAKFRSSQTDKNSVQGYSDYIAFKTFTLDRILFKYALRTIKLTLPKFNFYSQLAACQDIPDYYLCQEYTTFEVDGATFYNKVDEYKAKLLTLEEAGDMELDNNGIVSTAISTVSRHKYAIVGVVLIFFVLVVLVPMIEVYMGNFLFSAAGL